MEWIRRCAWTWNHKSLWFSSSNWTVTASRNAPTTCVGDKSPKYSPRRVEVWDPSTWPHLPSLEDLYLLHIHLLFFGHHTRNHVTWFIKKKLNKITKNKVLIFFLKYHNLNSILSNGVVVLPHSPPNKIFPCMLIS
jgi:Leucine-rich repeat (LRR) protein